MISLAGSSKGKSRRSRCGSWPGPGEACRLVDCLLRLLHGASGQTGALYALTGLSLRAELGVVRVSAAMVTSRSLLTAFGSAL